MFYTTTATKVVSWPRNWVPQRQNSVPRTRCEPRTASHIGDKSSAVTLVNCRREGGTHTHTRVTSTHSFCTCHLLDELYWP